MMEVVPVEPHAPAFGTDLVFFLIAFSAVTYISGERYFAARAVGLDLGRCIVLISPAERALGEDRVDVFFAVLALFSIGLGHSDIK